MASKKASKLIEHPPVEINLYRNLAVGFGIIVIILFAVSSLFIFGKAKIVIIPRDETITREIDLHFKDLATEQNAASPRLVETVVSGKEDGIVTGEGVLRDAQAKGQVTIFNKQDRPQTLVATTRLLSREGVLFRLKNRVTIYPQGRVEAEVYADKPGITGNISGTHLSIPGLPDSLQSIVYADSASPMIGGQIKLAEVAEADVAASYKKLENALLAHAEQSIRDSLRKEGGETEEIIFSHEILEQSNTAHLGTMNPFIVSLALHITAFSINQNMLQGEIRNHVKDLVPPHHDLLRIDFSNLQATITTYDVKAGEATAHVTVPAEVRLTKDADELAKNKFFGLTKRAVEQYLGNINGIDHYIVTLPFFLARIPEDEARIEVVIQ